MNLDWMEDSVCAQMCRDDQIKPDDFFPEGRFNPNSPEYHAHIASLRAICSQCSVMLLCREYADRTDSRHGFWGGETSGERHDRRFPSRRQRVSRLLPLPVIPVRTTPTSGPGLL